MRKKKEAGDESVFTDAAPPKRLTPTDIQAKVFRQAFRGYDERDVDEFLDRITEELARVFAENKRLREELTGRPTVQVQMPSTAPPAIRAGSPAQVAAEGPIREVAGSFIVRERDFLRSLAGLIQEHAESVKDDVRRVRAAAQPAAQPAASPPAVPATGSSDPPSASLIRGAAPAVPAQTAETTHAEAPSEAHAPTFVQAPMPDPGPMADPAPFPPAEAWPADAMPPPPSPDPDPAVVDLGASEIVSPNAEPARSHTQPPPPASEAEDQTIRELFWGEE